MEITLDIRRSVSENAQHYYERAKKARRKVAGARKALADTERKLESLSKKEERFLEERVDDILEKRPERKKEWYEKFRWFYSSDGFLVVGGKDATSNEVLVKKHVESQDTVFHADVSGAPFFVVKNPDDAGIPQSTLEETAQAAVSYSKAWTAGIGAADAYWIAPDQVSKSAEAGEYLTKGAFMIRGKKNYVKGVSLMVAIGIVEEDETLTVVGGPAMAIEKTADHHVALKPGDVKSGQLAKEVKQAFFSKIKKDRHDRLKALPLQDIQQWVPGGKGKIEG